MRTPYEMYRELILNRVLKFQPSGVYATKEDVPLVEQGWSIAEVTALMNGLDTALAAKGPEVGQVAEEHAEHFAIEHGIEWLSQSYDSFSVSVVDYFDIKKGDLLLTFDLLEASSGLHVGKCVRVDELITTDALECKVHYMYDHEVDDIPETEL